MDMLEKYAHLLVQYCLEVQEGDRLLIRTTTAAEPLVREVYRHATRAGAQVFTDLGFEGQGRILVDEAPDRILDQEDPFFLQAMQEFECYLAILAPYNLKEMNGVDASRMARRSKANQRAQDIYFKRIADKSLKRSLCQYPCISQAHESGMSTEAYTRFVYEACRLFDDDPVASWLEVRDMQQRIVNVLNGCTDVHYQGKHVDLRFSTKGRTWINSDGRNNMPSGEVFTSPVEDSVQGKIHFSYPGLYQGHDVEGVTLWVKDGLIERWEASKGQAFLDHIFSLEGTRRFGEAAIGTNDRIKEMSRNILFDEKIGGTVHLAIGQSYLQCGGLNKSSVHWDMITDMTEEGRITADGQLIYENGQFLI
ncbi:MAG: aminopeptidase [Saprospiraceae bacterium]|nr:aminopeptidase [Saprospiraceae bacterium]